jgi:hypothetical protein
VCKNWKNLVDREGNVWKRKLEKERWWKEGIEMASENIDDHGADSSQGISILL